MGIIEIILMAIRYLPALLTAIKAIVDFIRHLHDRDPAAAKAMLQDLRSAMKAARQGDPRPVQAMAKKIGQHCEDGTCGG